MALAEDLINFDIIEAHKENVAQLPGGRSARQLASILSTAPSQARGGASPTLDETKTLNDAIRQEYETELQSVADSDDPLDIYDRYVKWTLNAYPSAQATPQSQLLPLLERATKAFLNSSHYKNDPRYLKLWLNYIRLFSDTPKETFAFLARHNVGEGLALFYEEFAAWLEGAGRWSQADEVYKLGIEREARPAERLMRKYTQFQKRFEARPQNVNEPSSPALPTVRPALVAKIDPFSSTPRSDDPHARSRSGGIGGSTASRSGKTKMAVFSDAHNVTPPPAASTGNGWDSIGSIKDRKKENTIEPRPWAGETLNGAKKVGTGMKMEIFRDPTLRSIESRSSQPSKVHSDTANARTRRCERVFVDLEAVYPNEQTEFCFEELRAMRRGWATQDWKVKKGNPLQITSCNMQCPPDGGESISEDVENLTKEMQNVIVVEQYATVVDSKPPKQKRTKVREVKRETQTVKLRLESPTGPKLKRKNTGEPTMTFHSKAATDEIYNIFNQPIKRETRDDTQSGDETDFDDDDFSTTGESTGTGHISQTTSEYGEDETMVSIQDSRGVESQVDSVSPWSDFTASKHMPRRRRSRQNATGSEDYTETMHSSQNQTQTSGLDTQAIAAIANQDFADFNTKVIAAMAGDVEEEEEEAHNLNTPVEPQSSPLKQVEIPNKPRYIPLPPEDYEPTPLRPLRDPCEVAQNRLPFMTPITEQTESSLAPSTIFKEKDYFTSKTPSRSSALNGEAKFGSPVKLDDGDLLLSSPPRGSPQSVKRKLLQNGIRHEEPLDERSSPLKKIAQSPAKSSAKIPFAFTKPTQPTTASLKSDNVFKKSTQPAPAPRTKGPVIKDLQCNPCDPWVREQILQALHPSPLAEPGFFDRTGQECKQYQILQGFAKHMANNAAKAKSSPRKSQSEKTLTKIQGPLLDFGGSSRVYAVKKLLGKGAFAPVYLVDSHDPGSSSDNENDIQEMAEHKYGSDLPRGSLEAVKTDSPPQNSAWEFHILRLLRHRLGPASRTMQSIVLARECHLFADECYLVLDYHGQGTLLDLVNALAAENRRAGKPAEGVDEVLACWLSVELLRVVEDIHRVGILHGDLKPDNCLVRFGATDAILGPYDPDGKDGWKNKGLILIDFGRGIDTRMFDDKARFMADWASGATDCVEIREARTWRSEIDWFGVAGVVHSLLFGRYIDTVPAASGGNSTTVLGGKREWKLKEPFRRYWQGEMWTEVFHLLVNSGLVEGGEAALRKEVSRVRKKMEHWLVTEGEREGRNLRKSLRRAEELAGAGSAGRR